MANIGASAKITVEDIQFDEKIQNALSVADIIYMEGFFLPGRSKEARYFLNYCKNKNKLFVFNISAVYLSETLPEDMKYFVENCDILFGNQQEYDALCTAIGENNCENLLQNLCNKYENKKLSKYGKIAVVTNGSKSVYCMHSNNNKDVLDVPKIDKTKIKDTTGAGDSFVAGFLAGFCLGENPFKCLKWGCYAAQEIIQQVGCTLPTYSSNHIRNSI